MSAPAAPPTPPYDPSGALATGSEQTRDISACVIVLPVTLGVTIQDVEIFGSQLTTSAKLVMLDEKLARSALYNKDATLSSFTYQQDPANPDDVVVTAQAADAFANGVDAALQGSCHLNVAEGSSFLWWDEAGKSLKNEPNFNNKDSVLYKYASFANFVLAKVAYDVFGHPLAQAGIANDTAIVGDLNGTTAGSTSLGQRLLAAVNALLPEQLKAIYEQMLKQDPSRFNWEDASGAGASGVGETVNTLPRPLPWYENDEVRFEIIIDDYNVKRVALNTVSGNDFTTGIAGATITTDINATATDNGNVLYQRFAGTAVTVVASVGV